jgi:hypothetical protein
MILFLRAFLIALLLIGGIAAAGSISGAAENNPQFFVTAERCMACHNGLTAPTGEDVSIGTGWRSSMMANSARDPYWQAAVRREIADHPEAVEDIENKCSICHMPMARFKSKTAGNSFNIFPNLPTAGGATHTALLAADGVSCTACHQIEDKNLGEKESFTGGFSIDNRFKIGQRPVYGPYEVDEGRRTIMQSSAGFEPMQASHGASSEFCATCHTLYTHSLDADGNVVGELPEQVPYLEWRHSSYNPEQSCQSCHLPVVDVDVSISSVLGQPRENLSRHAFLGGNFFMPRVFNRYAGQLNVAALPQELNASSQRTLEHLESSAAELAIKNVKISGKDIRAEVEITNLAGHKLPTAYPSRRVWIHFTVCDHQGDIVFESGVPEPDGSIRENDNDIDGGRFEPHYDEIDDSGKVQIYEAIMTDSEGNITTGLLQGVQYVKDNRLLPRGFDNTTAPEDIAIQGKAREDNDFGKAKDRIRYSAALKQSAGPYTLQAELLYQPIGYRWAKNLRQFELNETRRFVSFYDSMAGSATAVLARATATVP